MSIVRSLEFGGAVATAEGVHTAATAYHGDHGEKTKSELDTGLQRSRPNSEPKLDTRHPM
jgi:hypothetical protein